MKYLLDTDHITIIQRGEGAEFDRLAARIRQAGSASVVMSIVSLHEQAIGAHSFINNARSQADVLRGYNLLARVSKTYSTSTVVPFDAAASLVCDELVARALRVGIMDLRIAAIAMSRGIILLTRNTGDFGRIVGLRTADWTT